MCQFSRFYLQNPIKKFRDKTMLVVSFLNKFGCCLTDLLAQNNIYLFLKISDGPHEKDIQVFAYLNFNKQQTYFNKI